MKNCTFCFSITYIIVLGGGLVVLKAKIEALRLVEEFFRNSVSDGDETPRRKQRGIVSGITLFFSPQAAGNLPLEIKKFHKKNIIPYPPPNIVK